MGELRYEKVVLALLTTGGDLQRIDKILHRFVTRHTERLTAENTALEADAMNARGEAETAHEAGAQQASQRIINHLQSRIELHTKRRDKLQRALSESNDRDKSFYRQGALEEVTSRIDELKALRHTASGKPSTVIVCGENGCKVIEHKPAAAAESED